MESLESRLGLLDEQLRTFSMAVPETDQIIRKVLGSGTPVSLRDGSRDVKSDVAVDRCKDFWTWQIRKR